VPDDAADRCAASWHRQLSLCLSVSAASAENYQRRRQTEAYSAVTAAGLARFDDESTSRAFDIIAPHLLAAVQHAPTASRDHDHQHCAVLCPPLACWWQLCYRQSAALCDDWPSY